MTNWDDLPEVEKLANEYYDFYKEVYGFRPRWIYGANEAGVIGCVYTEEEMRNMLVALGKEADVVFAEEAAREAEAIVKFEKRVDMVIATGAGDRATALRWIFDAEDDVYAVNDKDYFCYCNGLPYGYFKEAA